MDPVSTLAVAHDVSGFSIMALFWQAGFFVKAVMLVLIGMSITCWAIMFQKYGTLKKLHKRAERFEEAYWDGENLEELYRNTKPEKADHPMAKLFIIGTQELDNAKDKEGEIHGVVQANAIDRIRQMLYARMNREMDLLERGISFLATTGSTAPFIGLLGTVWGIMNAFQNIGAAKNTSLAVVAPGIAEALLATAIGLFAAIPAVMAYNKLTLEITRYGARLENFVTEFMATKEREQQELLVKARKENKQRRAADVA